MSRTGIGKRNSTRFRDRWARKIHSLDEMLLVHRDPQGEDQSGRRARKGKARNYQTCKEAGTTRREGNHYHALLVVFWSHLAGNQLSIHWREILHPNRSVEERVGRSQSRAGGYQDRTEQEGEREHTLPEYEEDAAQEEWPYQASPASSCQVLNDSIYVWSVSRHEPDTVAALEKADE